MVKDGKVTIVTDEKGRNIFPSIIAYADEGQIFALHDALPFLSKNPNNTIFNAKRFMGKYLAEESVQEYATAHPFRVIQSSANTSSSSSYGDIAFSLSSSSQPSSVTPIEVGTQVLKHLLLKTAAFLGHSQVNKAVIAVPAKFNALQRQATAAAFKAAGLKVVRVLEEPTAAAVAYNLHKNSSIHHILVYDFGGGTLDVSLLFVSNGSVQVYATDGDDLLGGSDFDLCLYDLLKTRIEKETGFSIELQTLTNVQRDTSASLYCTAASVHTMAEDLKKILSSRNSSTFTCDLPLSHTHQKVEFEVTREEFESTCRPLFERGLLPVTRLLQELGMSAEDVDEVVLVGGTTRIPLVKQQLKDFFGKELNDHIDPDITVAFGAASVLD